VTRLLWIYLAAWFPGVVIGILNGALRESAYGLRR